MRLESKDRNVTTSNVQSTSQARILLNSTAVDVLSSSIYTDKPLAVVRELCANAYDAHIKAGTTDIPFRVTLPSSLNHNFVVADSGVGLSEEAMYELYLTYFDSDKRATNELTGGLGLGSKSPLAYIDQFTVQSIYRGERKTYAVFKDQDGMPQITCIDTAATDEHPGLRVTVPVRAEDGHKFASAARRVLAFFPEGSFTGVSVPPLKSLVQGDGYRVIDKSSISFSHANPSFVQMGNMAYTLDLQKVIDTGNEQEPADLLFWVDTLERTYPPPLFVFDFEIGDLSVQASREGLSYDRRTVQAIRQQLQVLTPRIHGDIQTMVQTDGSETTPTLHYRKLRRMYRELDLEVDETFKSLGRQLHEDLREALPPDEVECFVVNDKHTMRGRSTGEPERLMLQRAEKPTKCAFTQQLLIRDPQEKLTVIWQKPGFRPYRKALRSVWDQLSQGRHSYIMIKGDPAYIPEAKRLLTPSLVDIEDIVPGDFGAKSPRTKTAGQQKQRRSPQTVLTSMLGDYDLPSAASEKTWTHEVVEKLDPEQWIVVPATRNAPTKSIDGSSLRTLHWIASAARPSSVAATHFQHKVHVLWVPRGSKSLLASTTHLHTPTSYLKTLLEAYWSDPRLLRALRRCYIKSSLNTAMNSYQGIYECDFRLALPLYEQNPNSPLLVNIRRTFLAYFQQNVNQDMHFVWALFSHTTAFEELTDEVLLNQQTGARIVPALQDIAKRDYSNAPVITQFRRMYEAYPAWDRVITPWGRNHHNAKEATANYIRRLDRLYRS